MANIKCKMCGGDLNIPEGATVAECEYCGSKQTIPNQDNEKKLTLFARADRLRRACEFDKAAGVYESIVAEFPEEAEAYWGLVLCRYGIEYVDDPATGKKVPTCHRSSFDSILEDADFDQACENADAVARRVYRDEAKAIENIRRGILEVSGKEDPYDIFICYKETDENGERTLDRLIIAPGETFSFWNAVRDADREAPYKEGYVLSDGRLQLSPGGGLCQISSFLLWLFLHTPLTITEQHTHGIDLHLNTPGIPQGVDAAVAEGWLDLKVKNNTAQTFQLLVCVDSHSMVGALLSDVDLQPAGQRQSIGSSAS